MDETVVLGLPADPAALIAAADAMASAGRAAHQSVTDAVARWKTLPDVFDTPDTGAVLTGMQPVSLASADFAETAEAVSSALRRLGENLAALDHTRATLLGDIAAHRATVLAYRASQSGQWDDPSDPLAGWGPYGFSRNEELRV